MATPLLLAVLAAACKCCLVLLCLHCISALCRITLSPAPEHCCRACSPQHLGVHQPQQQHLLLEHREEELHRRCQGLQPSGRPAGSLVGGRQSVVPAAGSWTGPPLYMHLDLLTNAAHRN
jgi:hypothetical protein